MPYRRLAVLARRIRDGSQLAWLLGALLALASATPAQDWVTLKSGKTHKGRIVYQDSQRILLRTGSREREIECKDVDDSRSVNRELGILLDEIERLPARDTNGFARIARLASERSLDATARLLWMRVLHLDREHSEAFEALDGRQRKGRWQLRHEGRWHTFEELTAITQSWPKRWTVETLHYRFTSNLPIDELFALAVDFERTHRFFFELVGRPLRLKDPTEKTFIQVHADARSFPNSSGPGRSYFQPGANTAFINASDRPYRQVAIHELVHALVYNTSSDARQGSTWMAGWLSEGLADYVRARALGSPFGRIAFPEGTRDVSAFRHFDQHAKPYRLSRVLNFGSDDFFSSTETRLKYAQSYTLVDYCLHGEDEALRVPFFEFLQSAYTGRSSTTDFSKALATDEAEFEAAWRAHVRGVASAR